jgi:hypothetical protein
MENLYGFPANHTLMTINNLVASLPLLVSFVAAGLVAMRSLKAKVKREAIPTERPAELAKVA